MDDLLSIAVSNAVAATVLALLALAVGAVSRRPALRHGLWLLVLLKLVTPPLLYLPISWPSVSEQPPAANADVREEPTRELPPAPEERPALAATPTIHEEEVAATEAPSAVAEPPSAAPIADAPGSPWWPRVLQMVWGIGALAWFLLALARLYRFRRLLRFAQPTSAVLQERTRGLAQSLGLKRCPCVGLLPGRIAPMLWAIGGRPRLLVPAELVDALSEEQLDTLLLHELAHLRRRDHWVRALEFVVMGLYWWHPVVWYARRELREAEEQCCDAWVVSTFPGTGRTYASALLDTLDFLSTTHAAIPPLASGLSHIVDLKRRLTMIMRGNTPRSLTWPGCLAVVAVGLTFLPLLPALHGQDAGKDEAKQLAKLQQEAQQFRDQARTTVEQQKAVIAQKKSELKAAEAQLKAAEAQAATFEEQARARAEMLHKVQPQAALAGRAKKVTYRIEITVPAEARADEVKKIVTTIHETLPENLRGRVRVQLVPVANQPRTTAAPAGSTGTPPAVHSLEPAAAPGVVPARNKASDNRIDELEKKLEKVLRELHDLRKQLKESRSRSSTPAPATVAPAPVVPLPNYQLPITGTAIPAPAVPAPRSVDPYRDPIPENPYSAPTVPLRPTPAPIRR